MNMQSYKKESKEILLNNTYKLKRILKTETKNQCQSYINSKNNSTKKNQDYIILNLSNISNNILYHKSMTIKKEIINSKIKTDKTPLIIRQIKHNNLTNKDLSNFNLSNFKPKCSKKNYNLNSNKKQKKDIPNKLITKNYTYKNHIKAIDNLSKRNKTLFSSISITPNKQMIFTQNINILNSNKNQTQRSKIKNIRSDNIKITCLKNKLSDSMINNNLLTINKSNNDFKISKKDKNKSKCSTNNIYINKHNNKNINNKNKQKEENDNNSKILYKKILVIDLDETLIHTSFKKIPNPDLTIQLDSTVYTKKNTDDKNIEELSVQKIVEAYIRIRPGVNEFFSQLSKHYDFYVYSASSKNYLSTIIKNIDKNKIIKKCYCRDDCIMYVENTEKDFDQPNNKYNYVKDLKKINKDLKNIVFIDNNIVSFKLQEKNGIPIKSWFDDYDDIELYKLIPILKNLSGFYDVRVEIEKFVKNKTFIWSKSINWLKDNCLNSAYLNEVNIILKKEQQISDFKIDNNTDFNNNKNENDNLKKNKNKIINNINNILINLNQVENNSLNKTINLNMEKSITFYEKMNTEINDTNKNTNNFKINSSEKNKFKKQDKRSVIKKDEALILNKQPNKEISLPKYSQKQSKILVKNHSITNNNKLNHITLYKRNVYIPKINIIKKVDSPNLTKKIGITPKQTNKMNIK
jgi:RNA polymerase II subunit A small phosphatase-like protein